MSKCTQIIQASIKNSMPSLKFTNSTVIAQTVFRG